MLKKRSMQQKNDKYKLFFLQTFVGLISNFQLIFYFLTGKENQQKLKSKLWNFLIKLQNLVSKKKG